MAVFSDEVEEELRAAGWSPGRVVDVTRWVDAFHSRGLLAHAEARRFLTEFGGLQIYLSGPGVSSAREPFELDPMLCLGEEDRFLGWSARLGHALFPVGELADGRFFLGIDEEGSIYLVETWVACFGKMPQAMEGLILGVQPKMIDNGYSQS